MAMTGVTIATSGIGIAKDVETNQGVAAEIAQFASSTELMGKNVLLYAKYIDSPDEKNNVKKIMMDAGATVTETTTTSASTLKSELAGKDAFVVPELYDDHWPSSSELAALTTTFGGFSPVLKDFVKAGGIVIVCEGDLSCAAGETVVNALAFTSITRKDESCSVVTLKILDPADPLMKGITSLKTDNGWMSYTTTDPALKMVADYNGKGVISRTGHFKIIGFDYYAYNKDMAQVLINAVYQEPVVEEPTISISTDKFKYCPYETMLITVDISNPTDSPVIFNWFVGAPTLKFWKQVDKKELSAGYEGTLEMKLHVDEWSKTPFGIVWYADLQDSETGQVLAADSSCCAYCPCKEAISMPTPFEDITVEIG